MDNWTGVVYTVRFSIYQKKQTESVYGFLPYRTFPINIPLLNLIKMHGSGQKLSGYEQRE